MCFNHTSYTNQRLFFQQAPKSVGICFLIFFFPHNFSTISQFQPQPQPNHQQIYFFVPIITPFVIITSLFHLDKCERISIQQTEQNREEKGKPTTKWCVLTMTC